MNTYAWADEADAACNHPLETLHLADVRYEPPSWAMRYATCGECQMSVWLDPQTLRRGVIR